MKQELIDNYERLIIHIQVMEVEKSKVRFYHTVSLSNFINGFDSLTNIIYKKKVLNLLNEYMNLVMQHPVNSAIEAQKYYNEYIAPVGEIYSKDVGFRFYIRFSALMLLIVVFYLVFYLLKANFLFYIITLSVAVLYYIPVYKKYIEKKVYGPRF